MFEHLKNIRKYDFRLDQYDNEPFSRNPLLKLRSSKVKRKKSSEIFKRREALVSLNIYYSYYANIPICSLF